MQRIAGRMIISAAVICLYLCLSTGSFDTKAAEYKETAEDEVLVSGRMWEKDGIIYTVYNAQKDGIKVISGDYLDTMILDGDKIYWRKTTTEGKNPCPIISMNLDGTEQEILAEDSYPSSYLCIYNDYLYYTSLDARGNKGSKKINLKTGEEEAAPSYMFRMGNDKVWFSTSLADEKIYSSAPGFKNIKPADAVNGTLLGVVDTKLYYLVQNDDGTYTTCSYEESTGKSEAILDSWLSKTIVDNTGLFYKDIRDGNTVLHRLDLSGGSQTDYNLGDFHLYMGGGFYELGNKLYFMRFQPENGENNTEFWEMPYNTEERELIGIWHNSNAENAAMEP